MQSRDRIQVFHYTIERTTVPTAQILFLKQIQELAGTLPLDILVLIPEQKHGKHKILGCLKKNKKLNTIRFCIRIFLKYIYIYMYVCIRTELC